MRLPSQAYLQARARRLRQALEDDVAALLPVEAPSTTVLLPLSFLLMELSVTLPHVVLVDAALDITSNQIPTAAVLAIDIVPSLVARALTPFFSKGKMRATRRITLCTALAFFGILAVATLKVLPLQLAGIAAAAFSGGLAELTVVQLTTHYGEAGQRCIAWMSSGAGLSAVIGALWWWLLRRWDVRIGLALTALWSLLLSISYFLLMPSPRRVAKEERNGYGAISTSDTDTIETELTEEADRKALGFVDKLRLARPLVLPFLMPLYIAYVSDFMLQQAAAPNLLYRLPKDHFLRRNFIRSVDDWYPAWQTVYLVSAFVARVSVPIFGCAALPRGGTWLMALVQAAIFAIATSESISFWIEKALGSSAPYLLIALTAFTAVLSALTDVHTYLRINRENEDSDERDVRVKEFRVGCVGLSDAGGTVTASLLSTFLAPQICNEQVRRGRTLCKEL